LKSSENGSGASFFEFFGFSKTRRFERRHCTEMSLILKNKAAFHHQSLKKRIFLNSRSIGKSINVGLDARARYAVVKSKNVFAIFA